MGELTVALLQMASCDCEEAAQEKGEAFCRQAKAQGADIALFPEMWNIGYALPDPSAPAAREAWEARAIAQDAPFFRHFGSLAADLELAIALTYLEHRDDGRPRNAVSLIDGHGAVVLTYAKVHTCEFDAEAALAPGEGFEVAELGTAVGPVKVGAMICYDREFPESARILMLKGAEIILTPNACTLEGNRLSQFRSRAYENMVGLAMANYTAPVGNGRSVAYDGMAFDRDEQSREMLLVEADGQEGVFLARFDLDALRAYRSRETWGNAFRRPRLYGALTDEAVEEPFIRPEATR